MLVGACLCRNAHSVRSVAVSSRPGAASTRAWNSYSECDARCSASHCSLIEPRLAEFTPSGTRLLWMMTTAINTMTAPTMNCIRFSPKSSWTHRNHSSSRSRFNAARFNPWASRAMACSPFRSMRGTRRSSAAISSRSSRTRVWSDSVVIMCSRENCIVVRVPGGVTRTLRAAL